MLEQALPCPFCGQPNPRVYQSGGYWKVKCVDGCSLSISGYVKKASALEAWNRRPGSDGVGELIDAAIKLMSYVEQSSYFQINVLDPMADLKKIIADIDQALRKLVTRPEGKYPLGFKVQP